MERNSGKSFLLFNITKSMCVLFDMYKVTSRVNLSKKIESCQETYQREWHLGCYWALIHKQVAFPLLLRKNPEAWQDFCVEVSLSIEPHSWIPLNLAQSSMRAS